MTIDVTDEFLRGRLRHIVQERVGSAIIQAVKESWEDFTGDPNAAAAENFIDLIGELSDKEVEEYAEAIALATSIFVERNTRYRGLWKEAGWRGVIFDAKRKMERLWSEFWPGRKLAPDDVDSALDQINFLAFFIVGFTKGYEGKIDWRIGEKHTAEKRSYPNLPDAKKEPHDI